MYEIISVNNTKDSLDVVYRIKGEKDEKKKRIPKGSPTLRNGEDRPLIDAVKSVIAEVIIL